MNNTNGEKFPESEKLLSDTPTSFSADDEAQLLNLSEDGNKKPAKMHQTPRLLALLVVFGLLALGVVSASTKEFHIRRPFVDCTRSRPVIAPKASPPAPEEIEKFKELLNSVEPASLHEVLHEHLKEKYQHGVYQEDRTAMEVVHKQDAAVAQSLIELAKRQASNTTTVATTSVGSTVTQAGSTTTVAPTTSVPSTSVAPTTTTVAPTTSVPTTVVTSTSRAPTQTETSTQAPTTSEGRTSSQTSQAPGSTRTSNSVVPSSGPSSSSGPASTNEPSSTSGPTSSNSPASSNGPSPGSTSRTGPSSVSSIPSSTGSTQGSSSSSSIQGPSSSPTSSQESTISSSSSNNVQTSSGSTSDSSSIANPTTGAGTTSIPSDSSITQQVVYKTTLANGAQSTVTSITVVPANQAQSGGSSKTSGGSASLQTNAASSRDIGVNALLGVLGMAAVAAL